MENPLSVLSFSYLDVGNFGNLIFGLSAGQVVFWAVFKLNLNRV